VSNARDQVLGAVRRALKSNGAAAEREAVVAERLSRGTRGPQPARAQLSHRDQVALFQEMAEEVAATVARVASADEVPDAVAAYLKGENLPAKLRMAPDAELDALPWESQPLLQIERGRAGAADEVSVTRAFAGVAETGSLMLLSGPEAPTTLNFLPENNVVVLDASAVVGFYEDAWDQVRARYGDGGMPRTVNFITGPSRTADIEQTIQLGAHGPRRLHIVLVGDSQGDAPGDVQGDTKGDG